jgi:cytidylate kinase
MSKDKPIITIDGSSAVGKGTLAKRLAEHFHFDHMDTGALYRIVALKVLEEEGNLDNENKAIKAAENLDYNEYLKYINDKRIRTNEMGKNSTVVACIPAVRDALLDLQREFGNNPPNESGAVLDGRDIGTTVLPDSDFKFYLTARSEVKAQRRYDELVERKMPADYDAILEGIVERDKKNQQRKFGQEKAAEDAVVIDTSQLDRDQVFQKALEYISI